MEIRSETHCCGIFIRYRGEMPKITIIWKYDQHHLLYIKAWYLFNCTILPQNLYSDAIYLHGILSAKINRAGLQLG